MTFALTSTVDVPVERAWDVLTDWTAHGRWIPFTAIRLVPDARKVGGGFVATTRLGPFRLVDPMRIVEWVPPAQASFSRPARCEIEKLGPALLGTAVIELWPESPHRTRVTWFETLRPGNSVLAKAARVVDGVVAVPSRWLFSRALRAAVAEMYADPDVNGAKQ